MIVEPPHEISPGTWICLFNDPSGVTFAMLEKR
jgi:predicted enzyme related to lactoylglutathione lyase